MLLERICNQEDAIESERKHGKRTGMVCITKEKLKCITNPVWRSCLYEVLYGISLILYLEYRGLELSGLAGAFPEGFGGRLRIFTIGLVLLRVGYHPFHKEEKRTMLSVLVMSLLLGLSWVFKGNKTCIDAGIYMIGAVGLRYERVLGCYVFGTFLTTLVGTLGNVLGLTKDVISLGRSSAPVYLTAPGTIEAYTEVEVFHSMGWQNGVLLGGVIFSLCMGLWILGRKWKGIFFSLLFVAVSTGLRLVTGDKVTSNLLWVAAVLALLSDVLNYRPLWEKIPYKNLRKYMVKGMKSFPLSCILTFLVLTWLVKGIGGSVYFGILHKNFWGILGLLAVTLYTYVRARRNHNGTVMLVCGIELLYTLTFDRYWEPLCNAIWLLAGCELQPSLEKVARKKIKNIGDIWQAPMFRRILGVGIAFLVFLLAMLPFLLRLSLWRTAIDYMGYREQPKEYLYLIGGYMLCLMLAMGLCYYEALTFQKQSGIWAPVRRLGILLLLLPLFFIQSSATKQVAEIPTEYEEMLEEEEELLSELASLYEENGIVMYSTDAPILYEDRIGNVTSSLFLGEHLVKRENVVYLTRVEENYPQLFKAGYYHVLISPYHAIYTNSDIVMEYLGEQGMMCSNCFSSPHLVDLENMAVWNSNPGYTSVYGMPIQGTGQGIFAGPHYDFSPGIYQVNFKVRWLSGEVSEETAVQIDIVTNNEEEIHGIKTFSGNELKARGESILSTTAVLPEGGICDFQLLVRGHYRLIVQEITWQRLWDHEFQKEQEKKIKK